MCDKYNILFIDDEVMCGFGIVVPPLIIKAEEIEEAFVAIDKALTIADNYVE